MRFQYSASKMSAPDIRAPKEASPSGLSKKPISRPPIPKLPKIAIRSAAYAITAPTTGTRFRRSKKSQYNANNGAAKAALSFEHKARKNNAPVKTG